MTKTETLVYNQLRADGLSHVGACAMMGNMAAESSMQSNIAQRGMTTLSDEQYTQLYDFEPEKCYNDAVGYGLCQWTYAPRKRALRQMAANWGVSVAAADMQAAFAAAELREGYGDLYKYLCGDCDLYKATEWICKEFENPEIKNVDVRYYRASDYLEMVNNEATPPTLPEIVTPSVEDCVQSILWSALQALGIDVAAHNGLPDALRYYADYMDRRAGA